MLQSPDYTAVEEAVDVPAPTVPVAPTTVVPVAPTTVVPDKPIPVPVKAVKAV